MGEKIYTKEEVIELLKKQKEFTIDSLGFSSAVYIYPRDFDKIKEWMMNTPILINDNK